VYTQHDADVHAGDVVTECSRWLSDDMHSGVSVYAKQQPVSDVTRCHDDSSVLSRERVCVCVCRDGCWRLLQTDHVRRARQIMQRASTSSDISSRQRLARPAPDENTVVSLSGQIQQSLHQQRLVGAPTLT